MFLAKVRWVGAWVLFAAVGVTACRSARAPAKLPGAGSGEAALPKEIVRIQELEDRRALADGQLVQWALTAEDPLVRARALLALGRLQEPSTADTLVQALADPSPLPRYEAAFAVGVLGLSWAPLPEAVKAKVTEKVLEAEAREQESAVRLALLEALGRLGTKAAVERLADRLTAQSAELRGRAALSLGIAAKRDAAVPPRAISAATLLIKKEAAPAERYAGAYLLALAKKPAARPFLLLCTQDEASEIRALCAKGLAEVGTDPDAATLKKLLDDPDYRVAVEATRALAKLAVRCKSNACPAIGALGDLSFRVERLARGDVAGGGQPLLALAQEGLPSSGRAVLAALREQIVASERTVKDPTLRADLAHLDCRFAAALDRLSGALSEVLVCGGGLVPEPRRLATGLRELAKSPAKDPAQRVRDIGSYVHHVEPTVKIAALEALGASKSVTAAERVRALIAHPDEVVAAAAASAAAKLGDREAAGAVRALAKKAMVSPDIAPVVAEALAELSVKEAEEDVRLWLSSTHAAVRHAAAAALTKLSGQTVYPPHVERPVDKVKPPHLPHNAQLHVKTEKGELTVTLYTAEAPLTSLNMYTLAKKGFFKNLTFHRVVPDFVVQGGDPRGDGEGGPGYTLRCEVNHKPYTRGVVGMALSGKDTGGSQLFVTTSPQPHLDGRYTAFGEVTQGLEVVDALLEGDKILEVRATP
ncbi:MAG: peptidylprolyl isomerase [Myxococcota bacterium]